MLKYTEDDIDQIDFDEAEDTSYLSGYGPELEMFWVETEGEQ